MFMPRICAKNIIKEFVNMVRQTTTIGLTVRWKDAEKRLPRFKGESHPHAITLEKAKQIALVTQGTMTDVAKQFGADRSVVAAIRKGTHWSCNV
jgi:hypothetical protein